MYQLTIRYKNSSKTDISMTRDPSLRLAQIRAVYEVGTIAAIEVIEVCPKCAGTGFILDKNKKRSRAGFSTACKFCKQRGYLGDAVLHKGN